MAAFGTVKPGFEVAAELQFPQQFSREYARRQLGLRYAPSDLTPVVQDYVGDDFFADYHAQKRADAQRTVMNGVADTRRAVNRAMVSHAGYYGLPAPVRSQRVIGSDVGVHIGANALYGAGISSAAPVEGLEGGVIGSREGREWVKNALVKRTAELDAIDAAKAEGPTVQAAVEKGIEPGQLEETEAAVLWQRILQEVRGMEITTATLELFPRAFKALTDMFSVPANLSKLDDYQYEINDAAETARRYMTDETLENELLRGDYNAATSVRGTRIPTEGQQLERTAIFNTSNIGLALLERALKYLDIIGKKTQGGVPTPKDMATISRSAAKSAKFGDLKGLLDRDTRAMYEPYMDTGSESSSSFTPDGVSYEVSNGPAVVLPRTDLRDTLREDFGRQGRRGEFRGERSFFGEDTDQSNWRPGVDVVEEAPRGFTNVISGMSDEEAAAQAEQEASAEHGGEAQKLARVRAAAEEIGLTSLADIEESVDAMPAAEARTFLNRIATHLLSAYNGKPTAVSRDITTAKSQINQLLSAASR